MELLDQHHPDLGVAIGIPRGWSQVDDADHADVVYLAEAEQGYRTSVALAGERLDPPTPEGFEQVIAAIPDALRERHPDLEVVRELRFAQEGLPAWLLRYRWVDAEREATFEQVMALIVTDQGQGDVVQVDAVTIAPLAEDHLPVIEAILRSVRPLPGTATGED